MSMPAAPATIPQMIAAARVLGIVRFILSTQDRHVRRSNGSSSTG